MTRVILILLATLLAFSSHVSAQTRCNCSIKKGNCSANFSVLGKTLTIRTSTKQCAQVVFHVGEQPYTETVDRGVGEVNLETSSKAITDHSCSICETRDDSARVGEPSADVAALQKLVARAQEKAISDQEFAQRILDVHPEILRRIAKDHADFQARMRDIRRDGERMRRTLEQERNALRRRLEAEGQSNTHTEVPVDILGPLFGAFQSGLNAGGGRGSNRAGSSAVRPSAPIPNSGGRSCNVPGCATR